MFSRQVPVVVSVAVILLSAFAVAVPRFASAAPSGWVSVSKPSGYYDWEAGFVACGWSGLVYTTGGEANGQPTVTCDLDGVQFYYSLRSTSGSAQKSWGKYGLSPGNHVVEISYSIGYNGRTHEYSYGYQSKTFTVTPTRQLLKQFQATPSWYSSMINGQGAQVAALVTSYRNLSTGQMWVELTWIPGWGYFAAGKGDDSTGLGFGDTLVILKVISAGVEKTWAQGTLTWRPLDGYSNQVTVVTEANYVQPEFYALNTGTASLITLSVNWSPMTYDTGAYFQVFITPDGAQGALSCYNLLTGASAC